MIRSWSVFIRSSAVGDQSDDMNVLGQYKKTYAGIVRGDSLERATVNATQKTGKPAPSLLIYDGEVTVGENTSFCPCCGENLRDTKFRRLLCILQKKILGRNKYKCPHCRGMFTGKVTLNQTILFRVPGETS